MGRGVKLTDEQWDELDRVRFTAKSADVFRNCLIILKSDSRDTIASIAEDLGCSADTVVRVRRLYRKGGVDALRPVKPPGRPGRATPEFVAQMRRAVLANPMTLGYGFSTWSLAPGWGRTWPRPPASVSARTNWAGCCAATGFRSSGPSTRSRASGTRRRTSGPRRS